MKRPLILAAALLAATQLTACDRLSAAVEAFNAPPKVAPIPADPASPTPGTVALTPTGKGLPVKAQPQSELQYSAGVVELTPLTAQVNLTGKLFGTAGGDPAMNGLYTYIAFYRSSADGWWVYQLGDFLSYKVLHEKPGQVDVEVEESVMDEATGQIGSRKRRIIIAFQDEASVEQPVSVRFMPAA